jgi:hypothetical protein
LSTSELNEEMTKGGKVTSLENTNQYSTGRSRHDIEEALLAAGKVLDHLAPADLDSIEDFHTLGRIATAELADLAQSPAPTGSSTPAAG